MNSFISWIGGKRLLNMGKCCWIYNENIKTIKYCCNRKCGFWTYPENIWQNWRIVLFRSTILWCNSVDFSLKEHIRLKSALDQTKGKFILSYNDCDYIRELYKEYNIIEVERMNNLVQGEKKPRYKEFLIKNY